MERAISTALAVALTGFVATAGHALNPAGLDIIGLRLGMTEPQVVAVLQRQGAQAGRIVRRDSRCGNHPGCDVTITAPTIDGAVSISLSTPNNGGGPVVKQISYKLNDRAIGEAEKIRSSMVDRFGTPDQARPMTWCLRLASNGSCPADEPSLNYSPQSLTLILKSGGAEEPSE